MSDTDSSLTPSPVSAVLLLVGVLVGGTGASLTGSAPERDPAMEVRVSMLETNAASGAETLDKVRINQLRMCVALKVECKE